ncbi:MAG: hypothetical protein IKW26_08355 [Treponema sp.]|nr:hypothetical protein [Treponema sp.]MDY3754871.1 hypothetical protein [Treponema sp.]
MLVLMLLIFYIGGGILYYIYLCNRGKPDKRERKALKQKQEYEQYMWDNYNHLCQKWDPVLEKWPSYIEVNKKQQITNDTVSFLADFKSNCALRVARRKCDCNRKCNNCGQYNTDKNCLFQCKSSCLACVQFRKYANCYVQLSEYQQMEVDQLAMKYFRNYIANGVPPGTEW